MVKKITSIMSIMVIMVASVYMSTNTAYASNNGRKKDEPRYEQVERYSSNASNLIENSDRYNAMNAILIENKKHETGILDSEIEQTLNEIGVFDDEIQNFPKELIDLMEGGNKFCVYINYAEVGDDGTLKNLSEDEINEYYEEKVAKKSVESLGKILGIESVDVSAKSESDTELSESKMLKQTLTLSQSKKGGKVFVSYSATWLDEPWYREVDACAVALKNASIEKDTLNCYYYYKFKESYTVGYERRTDYISNYLQLKDYGTIQCLASGVVVTFDLHNSRAGILALGYGGTSREYLCDRVNINFYATVDNKKDWRYVVATGDYWHKEKTTNVDVSFSFSSEGASFSISPSCEEYYNHISLNPYVKYYFK